MARDHKVRTRWVTFYGHKLDYAHARQDQHVKPDHMSLLRASITEVTVKVLDAASSLHSLSTPRTEMVGLFVGDGLGTRLVFGELVRGTSRTFGERPDYATKIEPAIRVVREMARHIQDTLFAADAPEDYDVEALRHAVWTEYTCDTCSHEGYLAGVCNVPQPDGEACGGTARFVKSYVSEGFPYRDTDEGVS